MMEFYIVGAPQKSIGRDSDQDLSTGGEFAFYYLQGGQVVGYVFQHIEQADQVECLFKRDRVRQRPFFYLTDFSAVRQRQCLIVQLYPMDSAIGRKEFKISSGSATDFKNRSCSIIKTGVEDFLDDFPSGNKPPVTILDVEHLVICFTFQKVSPVHFSGIIGTMPVKQPANGPPDVQIVATGL